MPKKNDEGALLESVLTKYGDMNLSQVEIDQTILAKVPKETFEYAFNLLYEEGKPVQKVYMELCKTYGPTVAALVTQTARRTMQNPVDVAEQNNTLLYATDDTLSKLKTIINKVSEGSEGIEDLDISSLMTEYRHWLGLKSQIVQNINNSFLTERKLVIELEKVKVMKQNKQGYVNNPSDNSELSSLSTEELEKLLEAEKGII